MEQFTFSNQVLQPWSELTRVDPLFACLAVLKRTVWKDKFEVTYVGPNQVLIKPLNAEGGGVVVRSNHGAQIEDVKIMGKDRYVVARTTETLLVGDLEKKLISEVSIIWHLSLSLHHLHPLG